MVVLGFQRLTHKNRQAAQEQAEDADRHGEGQGQEGEEGEISESSSNTPTPTKSYFQRYPGYGVSFLVECGLLLRHSLRIMSAAGALLCITERTAKRIRKGHDLDAGEEKPKGRGLFPRCRLNGAGMGNGIECFLNLIL